MKKKMITAILAAMVVMNATGCGISATIEPQNVEGLGIEETTPGETGMESGTESNVETKSKADRDAKEIQLMSAEEMESEEETESSEDEKTESEEETELPEDGKTESEEEVDASEEDIFTTGEKVDTASMTYEGKTVTVSVPDQFYWSDLDDASIGMSQQFEVADGKIYSGVLINTTFVEIDEAFCDDLVWVPYYAKDGEETEVMTEEIDGRNVYYQKVTYDDENYMGEPATYEKLIAVCGLEDGYMMQVDLNGLSGQELDFSMIEEFFEQIEE